MTDGSGIASTAAESRTSGTRQPPIGRGRWVWRFATWSVRIDRRTAAVTATAVVLVIAGLVLAMCWGDLPLSPGQVLAAVVGSDDVSPFVTTVVLEWRAPRALGAMAFGAALAAAGAVFQSVTRNPLGSPDIIGFSTGSYTGTLVVTTVIGTSTYLATASGALIGGLVTAILMYALAFRGGVQGYRFIVVGVGLSAMLQAVNTYLILRADPRAALSATIWGTGSLSDLGWPLVGPAMVAVAVLLPLAVAAGPALRQLALGDDAATAHGLPVERTRMLLIALGVGLTATVTTVAGPIIFVALAAPHLARMLTRAADVPVPASAAVGSVLLLGSDLIAQHAVDGRILPVGVVTSSLGGLYLVWILVSEARRRR